MSWLCCAPARAVFVRVGIALALALSLLTLAHPPAAHATNVCGTIATSTTWTAANSPYIVTCSVSVSSGATLTIEPGVLVQSGSTNYTFTVNGFLIAVGTAGSGITFTSTADSGPGQWRSIGLNGPSATLKYVTIRNGGGGLASGLNGMVGLNGGTVTIEDSVISSSSVAGMAVVGGTTGLNTDVTIRRTLFDHNVAHGLVDTNAHLVIEDSAFWLNGGDGLRFTITNGSQAAASEISGSSMWGNGDFGVYMFLDAGAEAHAPDGNITGKLGNAIYENADPNDAQLNSSRLSTEIDWRNNYWGAVGEVSCSLGSGIGHLAFGLAAPPGSGLTPRLPGPVNSLLSTQGNYPNWTWCWNDTVLDYPAATAPLDLYFTPPPPTFGGLSADALDDCMECQRAQKEFALAFDSPHGSPSHYTGWPVNTATGSLAEATTDLRLAGPGIPFAWMRSYNSRDTTVGPLGQGWIHPFEAKLTQISSDVLDYRAGSGQRTRFTKISGGTGAASYSGKGFDGTLKRLADLTFELTTRDQRVFSFSTIATGRLTKIKARFLPATTLAYDGSNRLTSITDSAGRVATISYLAADPSLIEKVTLPDTRYVQYGYTNGRLTSVRDARGKTWTLGYDGNGRLTSIRDPRTHYELQNVQYDGAGRVTSEQNGTGDAVAYAYTTADNYDVTTVTPDGRGAWVYKHRGNMLMHVVDPLGHTTSYSYDAWGRRSTVKDGRGYVRRYEYDGRGNPTKDVAPAALGFSVDRTFNATNDLLTETDGRLHTTTYAYATSASADYQVGQLKTITDRENGVTTFKYWTTTSSPTPPATNVGLLKSVKNPRLMTTTYDYDTSGNVNKITSPLTLKTTMTYDGSGRMTSRRDPRGNVPQTPLGYRTAWTYDDVDHVATLTDPGPTDAGSAVTTYDYYDNELLHTVTRTDRDGAPRVTSFEYDNANRLWQTTQPGAATPKTRLYWPDGQLKSLDSPEHRKTTYFYNDAGQLSSLVEPNGNADPPNASDWTWTYGYDDAGNLHTKSHPDGGTTTIDYDPLDRPDSWTDALNHTTSVELDANGNVKKRFDGRNKFSTYTYDNFDRLKTFKDERQLAADPWTYEYYPTGELKCVTSPKHFVTNYGIDDDGRTTAKVDPRALIACGDPFPAAYKWAYEYDQAGNPTKVTDPLGNHVDYGYDALNQLTSTTDQGGNQTTLTYDVLNRLWKVTPPAAGGTGTLYTEYSYDPRAAISLRASIRTSTRRLGRPTWTGS